jgi:beta-barrel assembly-enhancing protease
MRHHHRHPHRCPRASFTLLLLLSLSAAGAGAAGCSSETAAQLLISPEDENKLGAEIKAELQTGAGGMQPVRFLQEPELRAYILGLADKVVSLGKTRAPAFTWSVEVIDDPGQVNAFATPGGYLYVYTGLLRAADNEAEVVGVMGHEVAHVVRRHFAQRLVQTYTLQGLIAIALGNDPNALADLAAKLAANGYLLSHSRDAETQADELGAELTHQAGYDPNGLVTFFGKLETMQGQVPSIFKYVMGHPLPGERAQHIREYIMQKRLTGGATNPDAFQRMRARLPAGLPTATPDGGA